MVNKNFVRITNVIDLKTLAAVIEPFSQSTFRVFSLVLQT